LPDGGRTHRRHARARRGRARRAQPRAVELAPAAIEQIWRGREVVECSLADGVLVYGLTTGIGVRKCVAVRPEELVEFTLGE
jgi:histidine ammonia-lyase